MDGDKPDFEPVEPHRNTKLGFPVIHQRPPFWVEFLLVLLGGYIVGIASILTCENLEPLLAMISLHTPFFTP